MTTQQIAYTTRRAAFFAGMRSMIPLEIGGIPFGIIFGALAISSGLSPFAAMGMSLFVFAGSAQFIGVGLVAQGATLPIIWLTTFIVNLRHTLYAASLAPYVKHLPQRWLFPLGATLTDESYVMTINHYQNVPPYPYQHWFYLGANLGMYIPWQLSTLVGVVTGSIIPDSTLRGLDFAMSATFISMVIPMLNKRPAVLAVLVSATTAVVAHGLPNQLWLILAAVLGVIAGVIGEMMWGIPETAAPATAPVAEPDLYDGQMP